jgi:hypothetical protein
MPDGVVGDDYLAILANDFGKPSMSIYTDTDLDMDGRDL